MLIHMSYYMSFCHKQLRQLHNSIDRDSREALSYTVHHWLREVGRTRLRESGRTRLCNAAWRLMSQCNTSIY
jgi:hypothetical protein